jgi:hypothetical protein
VNEYLNANYDYWWWHKPRSHLKNWMPF